MPKRLVSLRHQTILITFFADRLKVVLKERGVRHDLIDAVFALGGEDDLVRLLARVAALQSFLATDDGANLLTAYRRAANILKIEEKRDNASYDGPVDREFLIEPEEIALVQALDSAAERVDPLIDTEDFHGAMSVYSTLRPVVDAFFNDVTVNAPAAGYPGQPLAPPVPHSRRLEQDRRFLPHCLRPAPSALRTGESTELHPGANQTKSRYIKDEDGNDRYACDRAKP